VTSSWSLIIELLKHHYIPRICIPDPCLSSRN